MAKDPLPPLKEDVNLGAGTVIIKQVYVVHSENDSGLRGNLIGYFTTEKDALIAAHNRGEWGTDARPKLGYVIEVTNRVGATTVYSLESGDPITLDVDVVKRKTELKKAALGKLSREERIALGLE